MSAGTGRRLLRVQQLQLPLGGDRDHHQGRVDDRPRLIKFGIAAALQELLAQPSQVREIAALPAPSRARVYKSAALGMLERVQLEEDVRRVHRRRFRRAS